MKSDMGFTLIELLVVISILGIMAAVGLFTYTTVLNKARDAKLKAGLDEIVKAYEFKYDESTNQYVDLVPGDFQNRVVPTKPDGSSYSSCDRNGCGLNPPKTGFRFCAVLESGGSLYCGVSARSSSPPPENIPCDNFKIGGVSQYPGDAGAVQVCWVSSIPSTTTDAWVKCGDIGNTIDCSVTTGQCISSSGGNMLWYSSKTASDPVSPDQVYVYQGNCKNNWDPVARACYTDEYDGDCRWKFRTKVHLRP